MHLKHQIDRTSDASKRCCSAANWLATEALDASDMVELRTLSCTARSSSAIDDSLDMFGGLPALQYREAERDTLDLMIHSCNDSLASVAADRSHLIPLNSRGTAPALPRERGISRLCLSRTFGAPLNWQRLLYGHLVVSFSSVVLTGFRVAFAGELVTRNRFC